MVGAAGFELAAPCSQIGAGDITNA